MGGGGGGGLLGGVTETLFGDGGAGAAGRAAEAQQAQARANYNYIKGLGDQATSSGIASFEQDIKRQEKQLGRQEQLIAQIDPAILEASQQALKLMRGEESSTLKPVKDQRAFQRQQLLNRLREQLGPGAETSTAGIQALNRFDMETNNLVSGQQQSALQLLGNTAGQFNAVRPDMERSIGFMSGLGQGKSNLLFNQAQLMQGAGGQLVDTAGAQYAADALRGKQNMAFGGQLFGAGMTAFAGGLNGKAGGGGSPRPTSGGASGYSNFSLGTPP